MAFWALGAFDKIKNISIKDVTKKVKDYVQVTPQQSVNKFKQPQQQIKSHPIRVQLSESELMGIQLREYKKLLKLQEKIISEHQKKQREEIQKRQKELQNLQKQLIENEIQQKKNQYKQQLLHAIESGQKSIEEIIEQNIGIKQQIYYTKQK